MNEEPWKREEQNEPDQTAFKSILANLEVMGSDEQRIRALAAASILFGLDSKVRARLGQTRRP